MAARKFYVVWSGRATGIFDSWEEAKLQVEGYPGARYKAFTSQEEATRAFREYDAADQHEFFRMLSAQKAKPVVNYEAIPEIRLDAIAVDGACAKNPGPMEYRGVEVATGREVFHFGPVDGGTNNIAEFIAIIHAASMLQARGDNTTPIYSDSRTALSWIRNRGSRTKVTPNAKNERVLAVLARANAWIKSHDIKNPLIKWDTDKWGEIPADFGRK